MKDSALLLRKLVTDNVPDEMATGGWVALALTVADDHALEH
jgi:hypothetical protein